METKGCRELLMEGLDTHQPDWYIRHADKQDLEKFAYAMKDAFSASTKNASPLLDHDRAVRRLRSSVVDKLWVVLNAGVAGGLVNPT